MTKVCLFDRPRVGTRRVGRDDGGAALPEPRCVSRGEQTTSGTCTTRTTDVTDSLPLLIIAHLEQTLLTKGRLCVKSSVFVLMQRSADSN